jgi:hypothetical protein
MPPVVIPALLSKTRVGAASESLPKQWEKLTDKIPAMRDCFPATINVDLQWALLILNPENTVPAFEWEPGHVEGFGLLEIKFEWPLGAPPAQAWLYLPHHSFHRYNMLRAEIITKEIEALKELTARALTDGTAMTQENSRCLLHVSSISGFIV